MEVFVHPRVISKRPEIAKADDGTALTDELLGAWAERIEAGVYPGEPGPLVRGRPLSVGEEAAQPFSVRLDPARRAKITRAAEERHTNAAQVLRDLIDAL